MYIEKIEWLDKEGKEAILKVVNETKSLMCFSCPCSYNVGDVLTEPLECKDGKLITAWSSKYYDNAMQEIMIKLFGEQVEKWIKYC